MHKNPRGAISSALFWHGSVDFMFAASFLDTFPAVHIMYEIVYAHL